MGTFHSEIARISMFEVIEKMKMNFSFSTKLYVKVRVVHSCFDH